MPGGSRRWTRRGRRGTVTRSELQSIAAALTRVDAALDRCLELVRSHPAAARPPATGSRQRLQAAAAVVLQLVFLPPK